MKLLQGINVVKKQPINLLLTLINSLNISEILL